MARADEQFEQLTAYLDGELSVAERANVEAWLARDPEARRVLDELRRTSAAVQGLPRERVPGDFAAGVMARLERESLLGATLRMDGAAPTASPRPAWLRPLAMAASLLLVVTAGWFVWPQVAARRDEARGPLVAADADRLREKDPAYSLGYDESESLDDLGTPGGRANTESLLDMEATGAARETVMARGRTHDRPSTLPPASEPARGDAAAWTDGRGGGAPSVGEWARPAPGAVARARDEAAPLETRLQFRQLTNSELQQSQASAFGNRVTVEIDDPAAVPELVAHLENEMKSKRIPSLHAAPAEQVVEPQSAFYNVCVLHEEGANGSAATGRTVAKQTEAQQPGEVLMVMNVPTDMVAPLIQSLESCAQRSQVQASWAFNDQALQETDVARFVCDNVTPQSVATAGGEKPAAYDDNVPARPADAAQAGSRGIRAQAGAERESEEPRQAESPPKSAAARTDSPRGPAGEADTPRKRPATGAQGDAARAAVDLKSDGPVNRFGPSVASTQAAQRALDTCVTLAIQIRANPALQHQDGRGVSAPGTTSAPAQPARAGAPATRPAPTTKPAGGAPHAP